jgi:hypothetical protein
MDGIKYVIFTKKKSSFIGEIINILVMLMLDLGARCLALRQRAFVVLVKVFAMVSL